MAADHRREGNLGPMEDSLSLKNWGALPMTPENPSVAVDCGWGRLLFGQTFENAEALVAELLKEAERERDVAFYVREPHVLLAEAPQSLFLDPSHTLRLDLGDAEGGSSPPVATRSVRAEDEGEVNRLYLARGMVPLRPGFCGSLAGKDVVTLLVEDDPEEKGRLIGAVMGVDHVAAFGDPDNGSSLWALVVDPQAKQPGLGEALVSALVSHYRARGRSFMDLSVLHDNRQAIALYEKLGFKQVPIYCVKRRNTINQDLYTAGPHDEGLNVYARIIVHEARRRGIQVEVEDAEAGLFTLSYGAREIDCYESLSGLTTAVALTRCADKALTRRTLEKAGLSLPAQVEVASAADARELRERVGRVVIKPAVGEQGRGVAVDLTTEDAIAEAIAAARAQCRRVLAEEFIPGEDLRVIVIDGEVVAAAIRRPAAIVGDGTHSIKALVEKQDRRRRAATQDESQVPLDAECERCVRESGHEMTDVLPEGEVLPVRKTANLHTGGTIHDVTAHLHADIAAAAIRAAEALRIPVVGLDFIVEAPDRPAHWIIEANERPGLANHEPQPTAAKFIDFLFPETKTERARSGGRP